MKTPVEQTQKDSNSQAEAAKIAQAENVYSG